MKQNSKKRVSISVITVLLLVAVFCASFSSLSITAYAAGADDNEERFEVDGISVDRNTLLVLSRLESIEMRLDGLADSEEAKAFDAEKKYDGIFKGKADKETVANRWKNSLQSLNAQLPGLVNMIKDLEDGGDFDTASTVRSLVSTTSSVLSLCGPICGAIGAGLECVETLVMLGMGGSESSSELVQMEDRLNQQFDEIQNELDVLEGLIKDLSDSINDSTNKIIEEMPAALEREADKQDVKKFLLRYEGNFSYNQFRNYLYGDTINNSNSSTAYYSWLQYALVNGESEDLVRRYYDDLYYSIINEIDDFEDYLAPNDDNIKSIVKTYYDYLSSNPNFSSNYGMTPEEAAIQFAYELYQTELMADSLIMTCNTYQYMQMLLNEQDYYESYNGSFVIAKSQIDEMYSSIEARQNNISSQIAKDMAYVLGLNRFYIVQETDKQMYLVNNTSKAFGNVYSGQTVYLNQMSDAVCRLFDYDKYAFTYEVNSFASDGYFGVNDNSPGTMTVNLQYQGNTIQTTAYHTTATNGFTGGTGTYSDPYLISTKEQFMLIEDGLDKHYVLTRNIDFNGATLTPFGCTSNPSGGESVEEFTGTLDGNGHIISNFNIEGRINTGLFATIGSNGSVCNLSIVDACIKANPNQATTTQSQFFVGAFAGENYGKIKNCVVSKSESAEEANKEVGVFFDLNNTTINRNIYVYIGGISGVNSNLVSCCKVQNITVKANSEHSFGGENTKTNKNSVYAGGLVGCNSGLLGYSLVDAATTITAKSASTLSPKTTVNPYVVGVSGGICGKVDTSDYEANMVQLHSAATTIGSASIHIVDSNWGRHYNNRQQNGANENNCYIPGWTDDKIQRIRCTEDALKSVFNNNAQYCVELENIKAAYLAGDASFDTSSMTISVTDQNSQDTAYIVTDYSIVNVYGFVPFNTSFDIVRTKDAVLLIRITLDDGTTFVTSKTVNYTIDKNGIDSVEITQDDKNFFVDHTEDEILMSELNGKDNVTYNYYVGTGVDNFDSNKLTNYVVKTEKCVKCDKCGSYNIESTSIGSNIAYECQEEKCHHTGFTTYQVYDYLFKGEIGKYVVLITGTYDGVDVSIALEYFVHCPHIVNEEQYLERMNTIAPTCISLGYTEYQCTQCKEIICKDYIGKSNVHSYKVTADALGNEPSEPTCYQEGFSGVVICSICGYIEDMGHSIPKLEHNYEEIIYVYENSNIKLDEHGNKVSDKHKCTNAEIAENGNPIYHYENHQYKVTESVLPKTTVRNGKEYVEYYVVYTYSCECGYSKIIPDENLIVDENSELPTVIVSNGYAVHGNDEVIVYVQLLNNPGIAGANFGIRYDSRLKLKEFSDGTVISGSITSDSNEVNFGYNFVWANSDYRSEDGNLLKLVFVIPEDAMHPTDTAPGDIYSISVVYNIENGAEGGFTVSGKKQPQCFITRDGTITMVKRLPGDVNNDGIVDLLDAVEIGQFLVHKKDTIDETYANVDLSQNNNGQSNVNVSDMVAILQSITGGYGMNLLSQEFQVALNGNGFDLGEADWLYVSIYNEYNNTYKEAGLKELVQKGYKFDGWWTKLVGGEQIILADGQLSGVQYFDYQNKQTLYAHWTLNSVTLDGNGNTNNIEKPEISYSNDYEQGAIDSHYEQKYTVVFSDKGKNHIEDSVEKALTYTLLGWATSKENADKGIISYSPNLSEFDLSVINLGQVTLYAVWDDGALQYPTWNKQDKGYNAVQWYTNPELSALLNTNDAKTSNQMIKTKAILDQSTGKYISNVYAKFTPISYTIKFDANGGTGSKTAETHHNADTIVTLNLNGGAIKRTGWKFIGWSTTPTGNVTYGDGASVGYIPTPTKQSDGTYAITLYAVWEPYKYGINYNMNIPTHALKVKNGSSEYSVSIITDQNLRKDSQIYEMGKKYNLPKNVYSILGWEFVGWSLNQDGSGEIYADCAEITNLAVCDGGNETITLYAVWKVTPNAVGGNVSNGVIVSDTNGLNKYIVYNLVEQTPQIRSKDGVSKVVVDWSKYSGNIDYPYAVTHDASGKEISRYGGGNTNLDISYGITEVFFVGNPKAMYTDVHIYTVGYPAGAALTIHLKDMNFSSDSGIINSWYGDKAQDLGMQLTVDCLGTNTITATSSGGTAILNRKNLKFIGSGNLTVKGGNGASATTAGGNGVDGGIAIVADYVEVFMPTGKLTVTGGNGGAGYKGADSTKQGSTGWKREWVWQGKAGTGGQGGTGGDGGYGGNGGDAMVGTLIVKDGTCSFVGGAGGAGGKGGKGGKGGTGGGNTAWGGETGDGGKGGTGGKGGDAGHGGYNNSLTYSATSVATLTVNSGANGTPGDGGYGGDPGDAGTPNDMCGGGGKPGSPGDKGADGGVRS